MGPPTIVESKKQERTRKYWNQYLSDFKKGKEGAFGIFYFCKQICKPYRLNLLDFRMRVSFFFL